MAIMYTVTMLLFVQMAGSTIELAITIFYGLMAVFVILRPEVSLAELHHEQGHFRCNVRVPEATRAPCATGIHTYVTRPQTTEGMFHSFHRSAKR